MVLSLAFGNSLFRSCAFIQFEIDPVGQFVIDPVGPSLISTQPGIIILVRPFAGIAFFGNRFNECLEFTGCHQVSQLPPFAAKVRS